MALFFSDLIAETATQYGIDGNVIKAIIAQESKWNPYAIRYESNYKWLYHPENYSKHPLISLATEVESQKISWGLGQIMGALAREQGHMGLMGELLDPKINIMHIGIRLKDLSRECKKPEEFFAAYNGGIDAVRRNNGKFKNQPYVDSANGYLIKFQSP